MSISRLVPPLDYLRAASRTSLQSFELARLNHAANLKREIAALIDQWIQERSEATLARWMLDHHESLHNLPPSAPEPLPSFPELEVDLLPDSPMPRSVIIHAPPCFSNPQRTGATPAARKPQKQKPAAAS
jgi:hypothetical protein